METEFEFIKGYENLYKINKQGVITSCSYNNMVMRPQTSSDGYLKISLKTNGKRTKHTLSRLIALQYIPNPNNLEFVDHIDRNKLNNDLSNLRWVDRTTNNRNKDNYKDNLTPEQLESRKAKKRHNARVWAEKKRRELGLPIAESKLKYNGLELREGKKYIPRV